MNKQVVANTDKLAKVEARLAKMEAMIEALGRKAMGRRQAWDEAYDDDTGVPPGATDFHECDGATQSRVFDEILGRKREVLWPSVTHTSSPSSEG